MSTVQNGNKRHIALGALGTLALLVLAGVVSRYNGVEVSVRLTRPSAPPAHEIGAAVQPGVPAPPTFPAFPAFPTFAEGAPGSDGTVDLLDELRERFGMVANRLTVSSGESIRLEYDLPAGPTAGLVARTADEKYAADSLRFRQAFDQAVFLWARAGRDRGVKTITVKWQVSPEHTQEWAFYPEHLRHPNDPPSLGRPSELATRN